MSSLRSTGIDIPVSIPYRLATNLQGIDVTKYVDEFQFLIGWLQTRKLTSVKSENIEFQFLIGWLQTHINVTLYKDGVAVFQFLIGWLQTCTWMNTLL